MVIKQGKGVINNLFLWNLIDKHQLFKVVGRKPVNFDISKMKL